MSEYVVHLPPMIPIDAVSPSEAVEKVRQLLLEDVNLTVSTVSLNQMPEDKRPDDDGTISIYGQKYTIEFIDKDTISKELKSHNSYYGMIDSERQIIYLADGMHPDKIERTLIHEITHAIIDDKLLDKDEFDEEDLCNITSQHFKEISRIIDSPTVQNILRK